MKLTLEMVKCIQEFFLRIQPCVDCKMFNPSKKNDDICQTGVDVSKWSKRKELDFQIKQQKIK